MSPLVARPHRWYQPNAALYVPTSVVTITKWNDSDRGPHITLTNNFLTATTSSGGYDLVRSEGSTSSGKYYWEITLDTSPTGELIIIGIANSNESLSNFPGQSGDSVGYDPAIGGVWGGGTFPNSLGTIQTSTTGDVIGLAWDFSNKLVWVRTNSGNWNNDVIGNQNPVSGTGGLSFSTINSGPYFAAAGINTPGTACTANFSATPPSGFSNLT